MNIEHTIPKRVFWSHLKSQLFSAIKAFVTNASHWMHTIYALVFKRIAAVVATSWHRHLLHFFPRFAFINIKFIVLIKFSAEPLENAWNEVFFFKCPRERASGRPFNFTCTKCVFVVILCWSKLKKKKYFLFANDFYVNLFVRSAFMA